MLFCISMYCEDINVITIKLNFCIGFVFMLFLIGVFLYRYFMLIQIKNIKIMEDEFAQIRDIYKKDLNKMNKIIKENQKLFKINTKRLEDLENYKFQHSIFELELQLFKKKIKIKFQKIKYKILYFIENIMLFLYFLDQDFKIYIIFLYLLYLGFLYL
jgi:hypothetical protein